MAFRSALIKFRIFWFLLGLSVAVSSIIWFESVLGLDITEEVLALWQTLV